MVGDRWQFLVVAPTPPPPPPLANDISISLYILQAFSVVVGGAGGACAGRLVVVWWWFSLSITGLNTGSTL